VGGGIGAYGVDLTVTKSTVSHNFTPGDGGGIFSYSASAYQNHTTTITNSTITGNTAEGRGGGVFNHAGLTVIQNSTITDNEAPANRGSGIASVGDNVTRTEVLSSIIAGNRESDVDFVLGGTNSFQSNGYNLVGSGNAIGAFTNSDQTGIVDPGLGPLADNGGPTQTHALLPGSPAIDAGDPAAMAGVGDVPLFDQRTAPFGRVVGGRIDIGALESQLPGDMDFDGDQDFDDIDDFVLGLTDQAAYEEQYGVAPSIQGDMDDDGDQDFDDIDDFVALLVDALAAGDGTGEASGTDCHCDAVLDAAITAFSVHEIWKDASFGKDGSRWPRAFFRPVGLQSPTRPPSAITVIRQSFRMTRTILQRLSIPE
jgi:hypothetical protein